ncbi:MAG: tetratricopeptide repeat protein [Bacteroides sp.]|nr:tetratricopeptide repeat protein [Bacteroides sp.]
MSIEKPANERLKLYERFRDSLAKGGDSDAEFFDADDLLIIIDQAVDLDDEYVEIEAIMRGYRFFPDNEELRARRAFLYFDLNLDRGVENIQAALSPDSPMKKILSLRSKEGSIDPDTAKRVLDSIVVDGRKFDDETIIQLVDCASACECYDWLKANEKRLRKATDYLPTLLYELFIVADLRLDRAYGIKLLEELTEIEPFNVDFWNALAQTQVNVAADPDNSDPDYESALTTLDYALAIDPDNQEALTLKASVLIELNRPDQALETIEPLKDKIPNETAAEIYLRALFIAGREINDEISRLCQLFPESESLNRIAISMIHPDAPELTQLHFQSVVTDEAGLERWAARISEHYGRGELMVALLMLRLLRINDAMTYEQSMLYFTCMYCLDMFDECITEFNDYLDNKPEELNPTMIIAGMMSYLKKGQKRPAKQVLKKLHGHFPLHIRERWLLSSRLDALGMSYFMNRVEAILDTPGPIDADSIDFFQFPNSPDSEE